jgi:hypothetical protein
MGVRIRFLTHSRSLTPTNGAIVLLKTERFLQNGSQDKISHLLAISRSTDGAIVLHKIERLLQNGSLDKITH